MTFPLAMALALLIDSLIGWPAALYARIGHPVTWLGAVIRWADTRFNREGDSESVRRRNGMVVMVTLVGGCVAGFAGLQQVLPDGVVGIVLIALLAWPLIAARSMAEHVRAVADPLLAQDIAAARYAVSMIVGRDVTELDATGVARAGLESLAENTSDGITAPLFWGALFGLPGIVGYKVINTLDSMVGYRTPRHFAFGWASARIDDVVNWVPARLTGLVFALCSGRLLAACSAMWADAGKHRSPNAGWPEAAMAGALGVRVSGPRLYDTGPTDDAFVNAQGRDPVATDLAQGLVVYWRALWVMGLSLLVFGGLGHA